MLNKQILKKIGQNRYDLDMKAWAAEGVNNDKGVHSVGYLMQFYKWKLEYLDNIWLKINIPTLRGGVSIENFE